MNKRVWNALLSMAGIVLGVAGCILILYSVFSDKDTLKWGLLCVVLGGMLAFARMLWKKYAP